MAPISQPDSAVEADQQSERTDRAAIVRAAFVRVRNMTEHLAAPLSDEDACAQSMPDASPAKWHRAHTTWFFDTFVVQPYLDITDTAPPAYAVMFNSYYNGVGEQFDRPSRGLLTRPSAAEVGDYRRRVDELVNTALTDDPSHDVLDRVELGLHHEQQHQELLLTDIKHLLAQSPLSPAYAHAACTSVKNQDAAKQGGAVWQVHDGGIVHVGARNDTFAFDNELPQHQTLLQPFALATELVRCDAFMSFIKDGGYERPELWLSAGWDAVQRGGWRAPLYWKHEDGAWTTFTLFGRRPVCDEEPVAHVSFFEADAFARWAGARLPTEFEWEFGTGAPTGRLLCETAPTLRPSDGGAFGNCWQWTSSDYAAYPTYRPAPGAIGEYNGKFMSGQYVLRGSSCVTSIGHARLSYRNFFPPSARWQCAGIRLAKDVPR